MPPELPQQPEQIDIGDLIETYQTRVAELEATLITARAVALRNAKEAQALRIEVVRLQGEIALLAPLAVDGDTPPPCDELGSADEHKLDGLQSDPPDRLKERET